MDSGVIATAALLGASHAVEPDHLAGIVEVSGGADGTRGAAVGAWFALGHVVLVVGLVGAAFTLSPPLTMLGFLTVVLPRVGPAGVGMAVGTYAVAIVATMAAVGVVGGTAVGSLGGLDRRLAATGKLAAACVLAGLGVATLV